MALAQVLLDAVGGPLLLYAALRGRAGLTAATLYALALPVAVGVKWEIPDALTTFLSLAAVCPVLIWRSMRGAALSGFMLGLAGWFRSDFLMLMPLLAVVIFAMLRHRGVLAFGLAWFGPALALALWFYATYGTFSFTRPGAGLNLWEGLGEYPNQWGIVTSDDVASTFLASNGLQYGSAAGDAFLAHEYVRHLAEGPSEIVGQVARRFGHVVTLRDADWGNAITDYTPLILGLMLFATVGFYVNRARPVTWAFGALWLSRAVPFSVLHYEPRYVLPVLACYIAGAGLAVEWMLRRRTL